MALALSPVLALICTNKFKLQYMGEWSSSDLNNFSLHSQIHSPSSVISPLVRYALPWRRQAVQMRQKILAVIEICISKLLLSSSMQTHCLWKTEDRLQACLSVSFKKPSCVKITFSFCFYAFVSHFLLYALVLISKQHRPANCLSHSTPLDSWLQAEKMTIPL